jgi:DNA-binding transcriptional LysR family regulator
MDRFEAMRIFATVARQGSFAEAARRLRLSPSAVTRSVAQLEDHLGLMLLTRTTRALRLTERGEIYLVSCQRILAEVDTAELQARGENAAPRGEMKIAAPILFGRLHVLPIVTRLLTQYRDLSIQLHLSDRNTHLVEDGMDAAIRIGDLADSTFIAIKLGQVRRILAASPTYLAARGTPQTPADLVQHDIIAFGGIDTTHEWRFANAENIRLEPRLIVNNADATIAAAEAGLGITRALSYQMAAPIQAGKLTQILQPYAPPPIPITLIHPTRRTAANTTALIQAARQYYAENPVDG